MAILLCRAGFDCCCLDLPGHGASEGTPGLLTSHKAAVGDIAEMIKRKADPSRKTFLYGTSMVRGGAG